ncbi:MAG: HNH endonuclease [Acidiphilium sp.]|nr:HNH endonuclease [Acidiphilium sp.]
MAEHRVSRRGFSHRFRRKIFAHRGGECHYCNTKFANPYEATVDHLIPLSADGSNDVENLVFCCEDANQLFGAIPREIKEEYASMKGVSWTCHDLLRRLRADLRAKKTPKRRRLPKVRQEKRSISLLSVAAANQDEAASEAAVLAIIENSITELLDRFAIDSPAPDHARRVRTSPPQRQETANADQPGRARIETPASCWMPGLKETLEDGPL